MCDTSSSSRSINRRSLLGAALAGSGVAVASALAPASGSNAEAASPPGLSTPLRPHLPVVPSQPKGTVLTQLGTAGGPQADYVRTGTSTVLTVEGFNYVVDAGRSSVTQYLNAGLRFSSLAGMFITHLHADHLADYYNYFLLEGGQGNGFGDRLPTTPLPVYGPGPAGGLPLPDIPNIAPDNPTPGIKDLTTRLNEGYAYSYNLFMRDTGTTRITDIQDIHEIPVPAGAGPSDTAPIPMPPFTVFEDDRVRVTATLVPHGKVFPAFAFRFDTDRNGSVVFSGDTAYSTNLIALATGADMLVHEVMNWDFILAAATLKGDDVDHDPLLTHLRESHTTTQEVAQVAAKAGVPTLVLTHLIPSNPLLVPDLVWKAKCSSGYGGNVHVGNDLDQIPLPVKH